jgi:hypothetical protein
MIEKIKDNINELTNFDTFKIYCSEIWPQRSELQSLSVKVNKSNELKMSKEIKEYKENDLKYQREPILKLRRVIGRRAVDRRNDIKIDLDGRLMFNVGSLIYVILSVNGKTEYEFLSAYKDLTQTPYPTISCLALNNEKTWICIGTEELNAKLSVWEISTHYYISSIDIPKCSIVYQCSFSDDDTHILCIVKN